MRKYFVAHQKFWKTFHTPQKLSDPPLSPRTYLMYVPLLQALIVTIKFHASKIWSYIKTFYQKYSSIICLKLGIFKVPLMSYVPLFLFLCLSLSLSLSLSLCICIYEFYSIKLSHIKLDPKDAKRYTLLSSKVWYHLLTMELSVLTNYQQTPN